MNPWGGEGYSPSDRFDSPMLLIAHSDSELDISSLGRSSSISQVSDSRIAALASGRVQQPGAAGGAVTPSYR
jgi:hypothetical protein